MGVIGTGGMGNVHTNHYNKMSDVTVVAWDVDPERLRAFCERHGAAAASSMDDLLSRADAVDVCLPTDLHLDVASQAFAAGKHVLVEKPMCGNVADCITLIERAEKAGVKVVPGHVVRFFKEFRTGHDLVASGKIGTPGAARTRRGGKAPMGSEGWFRDVKRSGGVLLDLAVHDFDWLRWTLGEVTEVYARSVALSGTTDAPGDYALATLKFANGAVAHVEATWMDPAGTRATFEVCGSEGMIEFDSRVNNALRTTHDGGTFTDNALAGHDDPYFCQLSAAMKTFFEGAKPEVTAHDGLAAVAIAEACLESAGSGLWVKPRTF